MAHRIFGEPLNIALRLIRTHWIGITWLTLVGITLASLWPLDTLPTVPGSDKIHHLVAYALLMFPTTLRKPKRRMLYGLLYIVFSGVIELIQPYVNRYGEWSDLLANSAGIVCGVILAEVVTLLAPGKMKASWRD